jgi:hypothetical protein
VLLLVEMTQQMHPCAEANVFHVDIDEPAASCRLLLSTTANNALSFREAQLQYG